MLKEFKQFLLRGNVVDLAVGVVIGVAFGAVVQAIVSDFINPLLALIVRVPDLRGLEFSIGGSHFLYGDFLNTLISFVSVAAAIFFFVIKPINLLVSRSRGGKPADPTVKKCPECQSEIPLAARRCSHCTQPLS